MEELNHKAFLMHLNYIILEAKEMFESYANLRDRYERMNHGKHPRCHRVWNLYNMHEKFWLERSKCNKRTYNIYKEDLRKWK